MPKKRKKPINVGPGADCYCAVCIFAKSHAPGEPYDLKKCPKCCVQKEDKTVAKGGSE